MADSEQKIPNSTSQAQVSFYEELTSIIHGAVEHLAKHFPSSVVEALSEFAFFERRKTDGERQCSSNFFVAQRARLKREGFDFDANDAASLVINEIIEPWGKTNELSFNVWAENGFINVSSAFETNDGDDDAGDTFEIKPIGTIETVFGEKHGTPRQGILAPDVRGIIHLRKDLGPLALQNLDEFSHLWVMWVFDQNTNVHYRPLVRPPRLQGVKTGVFATRSPHRPNPIGLSLVKIISIHKTSITVSGVDLVNGTAIVDLKPYIPLDYCPSSQFPPWIESPQILLEVHVSEHAKAQIAEIVERKGLRFYGRDETENVIRAIEQTLGLDPRSTHSKTKHEGGIYGLRFDRLDVIFRILDENVAQVEMVKHWREAEKRPKLNCLEWLTTITQELESM